MTRDEFLRAYKTQLRNTYLWAKDQAKLGRYMSSVVNTLDGANSWSCDGTALNLAYAMAGGTGKPTLKVLRALPVTSEGNDKGGDNVTV